MLLPRIVLVEKVYEVNNQADNGCQWRTTVVTL